jgi:hypothetical protein
MLLIFFLIVMTKKKPFASVKLNDLEIYSLSSTMLTFYCGIFFISEGKQVDTSSTSNTICNNIYIKSYTSKYTK